MRKSQKPISEGVPYDLSKTISSLVSSCITMICPQLIHYERSVDIFGVLSLCIDDNIDINVKINEKIVKKEVIRNIPNFDCSRIIETVRKDIENENVFQGNVSNDMDVDENTKETVVPGDQIKNDSYHPKRKSRKPQQTFRHIRDEVDQGSSNNQITDYNDLKFPNSEIKVNFTDNKSNSKLKDVQEAEVKSINNDGLVPTLTNEESSSPTKEDISLKCTICNRAYKTKVRLARHKQAYHSLKSFDCDLIGSSLDLGNQLQNQMTSNHVPSEGNVPQTSADHQNEDERINEKSTCLASQQFSWPPLSSLPIFSSSMPATTTMDSEQMISKFTTFTPFSYPSENLVSAQNKNPLFNTYYQARHLFTHINTGFETTVPHNNNSIYPVQHYPQILPATSQNLFTSTPKISKGPFSVSTTSIVSSNLHSLPLYGFVPAMFTHRSLEKKPLVNRVSSINETPSI